MKRMFYVIWLVIIAVVFCIPFATEAALVDNLNGTITDTDLGIMWLQTAGPDANFADAVTWANNLVFAGFDDWRLPSALSFTTGLPDIIWDSTDNEFGHLYYTELGNPANAADTLPMIGYKPSWFWTGTADGANNAYMFFWSWDGIWLIDTTATSDLLHVTAVRDITTNGGGDNGGVTVPEPSSLMLLAAGLFGAGILRRKLN